MLTCGKRRFIKNAAILTCSAIILRTVGMFFRVWLSNRIGSEGMGLYQLIFSVYMLVATFATAGISTAVTRLVAEELPVGSARSVRRILRRSLTLTLLVAAASAVLVFALGDVIAVYWIKDARAARSLKILAFSLPFMGVSSCIRGYFVALRRVLTPSNAQLFEQLVRMAVIAAIIGGCAEKGLEYACAAVLIGDTVAESASCAFSIIGYLRDRRKLGSPVGARQSPDYHVTRRLLDISLPIAGGRYVTTALRTAESLLIPDKLTAFNSSHELSLSQYGAFRGMAMPVVFFMSSFLTAISTLLVPELSGSIASGDEGAVRSAAKRTVHLTMCSSMLVAAVFFTFSTDIGNAFYGSDEVGLYVRALAPLIPLMYLESVVAGMLNGLDKQRSVFVYNVADSVLRIALIFIAVPRFGMAGFIGVTVISNIFTSLLCLIKLLRVAKVRFDLLDWVVRPLICALAAVTVAIAAHRLAAELPVIARTLLEAAAAAAAYVPLLYVTGGAQELRSAGRQAAVIKRRRKNAIKR